MAYDRTVKLQPTSEQLQELAQVWRRQYNGDDPDALEVYNLVARWVLDAAAKRVEDACWDDEAVSVLEDFKP